MSRISKIIGSFAKKPNNYSFVWMLIKAHHLPALCLAYTSWHTLSIDLKIAGSKSADVVMAVKVPFAPPFSAVVAEPLLPPLVSVVAYFTVKLLLLFGEATLH